MRVKAAVWAGASVGGVCGWTGGRGSEGSPLQFGTVKSVWGIRRPWGTMLIPHGGRAWRIVFGGLLAAAATDAFAPGGLALPRSGRLSPAAAARRTVCMAGGAAMPDGGAAPFGTQADLQDTVDRAAQGQSWKRKVTLLGSTGSIGTQTLDIVEYLPDR